MPIPATSPYYVADIYAGPHSPAEHFARVGYDLLAARAADRDDPADPWPDDDAEDAAPGSQARWLDRQVLAALVGPPAADADPKPKRGRKPKAPAADAPADRAGQLAVTLAAVRAALGVEPDREPAVDLAGVRCRWHRDLPGLKVWAGQATLGTLIGGRVDALRAAGPIPGGERLLSWRVPYRTMSGLDPRSAATALDIGFSPAALGMDTWTYLAAELLAVVGMAVSPITYHGYGSYGYTDPDGRGWVFQVVTREGYHRMLTMSQRAERYQPDAGGGEAADV